MAYSLVPLRNVWHIHRTEFLNDILINNKLNNNDIWKVWVSTGHIFVSLKNGFKLLTFDVKPLRLTQDAGDLGCLDLPHLPHPIHNILILKAHKLAFVILENGHMYIWKYDSGSHVWQLTKETDLCNVSNCQIISVCLTDKDLLWCECRISSSGTSNYCVCKRSFQIGEGGIIQLNPVNALIHNSPPVSLHVLEDMLYVFTRFQSTVFSCLTLNLSTKSVDLVHHHNRLSYTNTSTTTNLDFTSILLTLLPKLLKFTENVLVCTLYDDRSASIVAIFKDGCLLTYFADSNKNDTNSVYLDNFVYEEEMTFNLFTHYILCASFNKYRMYDRRTGRLITESDLPSPTKLATPITGQHPVFPIFYNNADLFYLQKSPKKTISQTSRSHTDKHVMEDVKPDKHYSLPDIEALCKGYIIGEKVAAENCNDRHFQHPALVLTILHYLSEDSTNIHKLYKSAVRYYSGQSRHLPTQFASVADCYIEEYLRLDEIKQNPSISYQPESEDGSDFETGIKTLLQPCDSMSASTRQSLLEQYAVNNPERVLECLMKLLPVSGRDITNKHLEQWAHVLMNDEQTNTPTVDFPLFHILCRLIFIVLPHQLVKFVTIVQAVHDRLAGVPAFLRRTQSLHFYSEALSMVHDPSVSRHPADAALAMAHLMLVSCEKNPLPALKLLLQYEHWDMALSVLQTYAYGSLTHLEMFNTTLTNMAQKQVLTNYTETLVKLRPTNLTMSQVLESMSHETHESHSPTEVLCSQSRQLSIGQLRPLLYNLTHTSSSL